MSTEELLKCPRCGGALGSEYYGPCRVCREQLRFWSDQLGIDIKRKHEEWLRERESKEVVEEEDV